MKGGNLNTLIRSPILLKWTGFSLIAVAVCGLALSFSRLMPLSELTGLLLIAASAPLYVFKRLIKNAPWYFWLKPATGLTAGIFLVLEPISRVLILGLSIFFYFLIDATVTIPAALEWKGTDGWRVYFASGVMSLIMASSFILFWPYDTEQIITFMVGVSLIMDGLSLCYLSRSLKSSHMK